MKRLAATLAVILTLGVFGTDRAEATNLLNVPHTHGGGCTAYSCYTWILANGAVMRGGGALLQQQSGYVLVLCSYAQGPKPDGNWYWGIYMDPYGPWGNRGLDHPYCKSPTDAQGVRWNIYPRNGTT
jgi:hypothetical protein